MFGGQSWIVGIVVVVAIAAGYLIAMSRKANAKGAQPSGKAMTVDSPLAPDAVFARLRAAQLGRFKLGDSDEANRVLVFASAVTPFSWGFFFPVFVRAGGTGTRIEAGIKSRLFQWGPIVARTHKEFVAALENAVAGAT
jgi:hypothetical protein